MPDLKGQPEVILPRIRRGTKSPVYRHPGEEFGFVLKGTLDLWVGDKDVRLRKGAAIRFSALTAQHSSEKRGRAELLWVITPPSC